MRRVVLASSNLGKLGELACLLEDLEMDLVPQSDLGVVEVEETGLSFEENALIKARHAARSARLPAIADDSGIVVDALNGAPGVYSARYAGSNATDEQNVDKLLMALTNVAEPARTAHFECAIAYLRSPDDSDPIICHGIWQGRILSAPRGSEGFGYDPIFFVPELGCASAELAPEVKNAKSHRGAALRQLVRRLRSLNDS